MHIIMYYFENVYNRILKCVEPLVPDLVYFKRGLSKLIDSLSALLLYALLYCNFEILIVICWTAYSSKS
jgi:hypothetical protein